jgi:hypothetical protein
VQVLALISTHELTSDSQMVTFELVLLVAGAGRWRQTTGGSVTAQFIAGELALAVGTGNADSSWQSTNRTTDVKHRSAFSGHIPAFHYINSSDVNSVNPNACRST